MRRPSADMIIWQIIFISTLLCLKWNLDDGAMHKNRALLSALVSMRLIAQEGKKKIIQSPF